MSLPSRPIAVRLPNRVCGSYDQLKQRYSGLPASTLIRFIMVAFFSKPMTDQIKIIEEQLRGGSGGQSK